MNTVSRIRRIVLALFIGLTAVASSAIVLPPPALNTMDCYHDDGSVSNRPVTAANPFKGGILHTTDTGTLLTTERCLAHLPPPAIRRPATTDAPTVTALMTCNGDEVDIPYANLITSYTIAVGVWTWREEGTGDLYVSTLPCTTSF